MCRPFCCRYAGRHERRLAGPHHPGHRRDRPGRLELLNVHPGRRTAASLADAKADARRVIERLGGQVLNLTGTDDASKQAHGRRLRAVHRRVVADRPGHHRAAGRCWPRKARWRGCTTCAPPAPRWAWTRGRNWSRWPGSGRRAPSPRTVGSTSRVAKSRRRRAPSERTPNYYPGGRVAGRPVPGGLVLGAVVEAGAGRRRLGCRLGVPVQRVVLGHGRSRLRRTGFRAGLR